MDAECPAQILHVTPARAQEAAVKVTWPGGSDAPLLTTQNPGVRDNKSLKTTSGLTKTDLLLNTVSLQQKGIPSPKYKLLNSSSS